VVLHRGISVGTLRDPLIAQVDEGFEELGVHPQEEEKRTALPNV
jgi:hypothetical protein